MQVIEFDIRNFTDNLTQAKKHYWNCPVCGKPKLTIDKSLGKHKCWNGCDTKEIARIVTEPQRQEEKRQRELERIVNSKSPQERGDEWVKERGVTESSTTA